MLKYIIVGVVCAGIVFSCKKIQPEMSVLNAGCDCAKEVSADFLMEETKFPGSQNNEMRTDTDTIYANKNVTFTAKEEDAEYTWYIGSEVIHERTFYRHFGTTLIGQTLPMILVVKKNPNAICLPNDDGYDSIVRNLVIADEFNSETFFVDTNYRLEGVFRFKDPNMPDSIDVIVDLIHQIPGTGMYDRIVISNFDGENSTHIFQSAYGSNYRQIWLDDGGCYGNNDNFLLNPIVGEIQMNMIIIPGQPCTSYRFKGRKLI